MLQEWIGFLDNTFSFIPHMFTTNGLLLSIEGKEIICSDIENYIQSSSALENRPNKNFLEGHLTAGA